MFQTIRKYLPFADIIVKKKRKISPVIPQKKENFSRLLQSGTSNVCFKELTFVL